MKKLDLPQKIERNIRIADAINYCGVGIFLSGLFLEKDVITTPLSIGMIGINLLCFSRDLSHYWAAKINGTNFLPILVLHLLVGSIFVLSSIYLYNKPI